MASNSLNRWANRGESNWEHFHFFNSPYLDSPSVCVQHARRVELEQTHEWSIVSTNSSYPSSMTKESIVLHAHQPCISTLSEAGAFYNRRCVNNVGMESLGFSWVIPIRFTSIRFVCQQGELSISPIMVKTFQFDLIRFAFWLGVIIQRDWPKDLKDQKNTQ